MAKKCGAKKVILVRHGEPEAGFTRRFLGRLDPGLSPAGKAQAEKIARRICPLRPDACWTSPLRRAAATAESIASLCGLEAVANDLLLEIDFGLLEGRTFAEATAMYPGITDSWQALSSGFNFPEGENFIAFTKRTRQLADLVRAAPEKTLLLVAHGGVLRGLLCDLLAVAASGPLRFRFSYAAVTTMDLHESGNAVLTGFNIGQE